MNKLLRTMLVAVLAFGGGLVFPVGGSLSAAVTVPAYAVHTRADAQNLLLQPAASKEADQIQTKVVVLKRIRHGDFMDIGFRMEFSNVPEGKQYQQCFWDMGMRRAGEKPSCMAQASAPDKNGKIMAWFELTDFSQGEWVQLTIRSTDGAVQKSIKFTPFK